MIEFKNGTKLLLPGEWTAGSRQKIVSGGKVATSKLADGSLIVWPDGVSDARRYLDRLEAANVVHCAKYYEAKANLAVAEAKAFQDSD